MPVKRRTLITVTALLGGVALLLTAAHYLAVSWPTLAYRPEIARPLRLDRPDSFGRWFMVAMLTGASGSSFLIYQLRRYRNDDFKGRYRLWRLVLIVLMAASVNSLVSIVDWGGALLDAGFGRRVALTGSDWIRLIVSLGGTVLALRLVAEVWRSRFALSMMVLTCVFFAIPEAAKWNVMQVETLTRWTIVTSSPLLACTTLFIALGGYLRMLYREVKQIENDSLRQRFEQLRVRVFQRSEDEEETFEKEPEEKPKRKWWGRRRPAAEEAAEEDYEEEIEEEEEVEEETVSETEDADAAPASKRRWFGRRSKRQDETVADAEAESESQSEEPKPNKKRRRFSMRLSPPNPTSDDAEEQPESADETETGKAKRGLGGWLRGKKKSNNEETAEEPAQAEAESQPASNEGDAIDPDDIDWNSLSKSERRRLRKKLKRQNRAA